MDEELRARVREAAERHALYNALKHGTEARVGAVLGPLMSEDPKFREHGDEVPGIVAQVVDEVNALDAPARRECLAAVAPELLDELGREAVADDGPSLPGLPNVDGYDEVRMRLAPNPNGPWHLGHARMAAVIGTYRERYDGWFACRFDDTDPETKRPDLDAYGWILDDIAYLGFEPDDVLRASDRLETYYDHARRLIDLGGAYTCSCPADEFSTLKNAGEACPHRGKAVETVRNEFDGMVVGEYAAGEIVLRVRTDIEHPNPALRDWVAFRLVDTPHPREEAAGYRCWPLLDFQSGMDDHLLGITHIVRGIDLQDSARRQAFVYDRFGWEYPEVLHWGHVQVDDYDVKLSTSGIRKLIEAGELDGWDDPRAPTLMSVRRRGIRGKAVTAAMIELGTSTSNVDLAMSSIYARNRKLIDTNADRLFLVREGVELQLAGPGLPDTAEVPVHPDHDDRGVRSIPVNGSVFIEAEDLPPDSGRVYLKGLGLVRHTGDALEFLGTDITPVREENVAVIHWAPAHDNQPVRLRTPTGDVSGVAEPGIAAYEPDDVVQFERVGFARIDATGGETVAYFAHP